MKFAMCGSMGVGKTSLLTKMTDGTFFPFSEPTIGAGFHSVRLDVARTVEVWDTSGQERYRALVNMYFRNATVVVMVYDVQNRGSFEDISGYWLGTARGHVDASHIYLIGNKSDCPQEHRAVSYDEGVQLTARSNLGGFVELSAKTSTPEDIVTVFDTIYRRFEHEVSDRGDRSTIIDVERPVANAHRRCC